MQEGFAGNRRAAQMDPRTLMILWGSMLTSQLLIAGITRVVPPASPPDLQMAMVLGAVSLGPAVMSLVMGRLVAIAAPWQTKWIVRWALAEAVTLMGFVSWMTGGLLVPAAAMMATGFLLVLVQFPRTEDHP